GASTRTVKPCPSRRLASAAAWAASASSVGGSAAAEAETVTRHTRRPIGARTDHDNARAGEIDLRSGREMYLGSHSTRGMQAGRDGRETLVVRPTLLLLVAACGGSDETGFPDAPPDVDAPTVRVDAAPSGPRIDAGSLIPADDTFDGVSLDGSWAVHNVER